MSAGALKADLANDNVGPSGIPSHSIVGRSGAYSRSYSRTHWFWYIIRYDIFMVSQKADR